jgi:hypothetical protein
MYTLFFVLSRREMQGQGDKRHTIDSDDEVGCHDMVNSELPNNKFISGLIVKMYGNGMVSVCSFFLGKWQLCR